MIKKKKSTITALIARIKLSSIEKKSKALINNEISHEGFIKSYK